jgi:hypothetical protein
VRIDLDTAELLKLARDVIADGAQARGAIEPAVGRATDQLYSWAQTSAPVRSGDLKASITKDPSGLARRVYSPLKQGFFQEYGTSRHPAQPWLMIHADRAHAELEQQIARAKWGLSG